jgi:hypothetical protein
MRAFARGASEHSHGMSDDTPLDPSPDDGADDPNTEPESEDATPGDAAGVPVASEDALDASSETFRPIGE